MKKVLICGLLAASFDMTAAQAATTDGYVQVTASLTAQCVAVNDVATPAVINFGTYTAFQTTAPADKTANVVFKCTRGLAITNAVLSATAGTVSGLAYTLALGTATTSGGAAASGGTGATALQYSYPVTGSMGANQAGDTTTGVPTTDTQTLTVTF